MVAADHEKRRSAADVAAWPLLRETLIVHEEIHNRWPGRTPLGHFS